MKKKLLCVALAGIMVFSPISVYADEKDDRIAELEAQVTELQEEIETLKAKLEKYEVSSDSDIEKYLLDKGLLSGDRIDIAAEMIGGIAGFKYGKTEIYTFDTSSDEYKELCDGKSIPLQGFEGVEISALAVNGKYVLIGEASDELISAFKEFK